MFLTVGAKTQHAEVFHAAGARRGAHHDDAPLAVDGPGPHFDELGVLNHFAPRPNAPLNSLPLGPKRSLTPRTPARFAQCARYQVVRARVQAPEPN